MYDPNLARYQLSPEHPFKPIRLELTRTLLQDTGLLDPAHELEPEALDEAELLHVHRPDYVEVVKAASRGEISERAYHFGLGTGDNPIFADMHEAILGVVSATVTAIDTVASGSATRAVNLSGGLHHAMADRASGFCLYNDLAVAIERAVRVHGLRVAYLDLDVHHGDGVQALFYDEPRVLTISLHESGHYLFPGTGHSYESGHGEAAGTSVNVPLEPHTGDDSLLEVFDLVVPRSLAVFEPDLIVLQAGADMHHYDPLAHLDVSVQAMAACYRRVVALADLLCEGRLVATGGGGYDPYCAVPRAWGHLWAALTDSELPEALPASWHDRWQAESPVPLPTSGLDDLAAWPQRPNRAAIETHNRSVATRLMASLTPLWAAADRHRTG